MQNKLKHLKLYTILFGVFIITSTCEKDTLIENEAPSNFKQTPIIKTITLDQAGSQLSKLSNKFNINEHFDIIKNTSDNIYQKNSESSNYTIRTDVIKEITLNDYKSYTMFVETEKVADSSFYNITLETTNNNENIFFVKYTPSEQWLNNKTEPYSGKTALMSTDQLENPVENSGGGGGEFDPFIHDCNGTIIEFTIWVAYPCGCGHMPWNECSGSTCGGRNFPSLQPETSYECIPDNSIDTNSGGSGNSHTNSTGNTGNPYNNDNTYSDQERESMVGMVLEEECMTSNQTFNNFYSALSPFTVDLNLVRENCNDTIDTEQAEANQKFMCIYNKLAQSPSFKNLFIDTFGESEDLNVKFEITDIPEVEINNTTYQPTGDCVITSFFPETGLATSVDLRIRIHEPYLNVAPSFDVARTIIHEAIHAFLQLKHKNCNLGTSLEDLNNTTLGSLLSQYFDNCASGQEEHELMFDEMIPAMQTILSEIRDSFLTPQEIAAADIVTVFENESPNAINGLPYQPWSWTQFYYYSSLQGLGNTETFQNEIIGSKATNFHAYRVYGISNFNSPCND